MVTCSGIPSATNDDLKVEVGDVIKYIDVSKPDDLLTVQITVTTSSNFIVSCRLGTKRHYIYPVPNLWYFMSSKSNDLKSANN